MRLRCFFALLLLGLVLWGGAGAQEGFAPEITGDCTFRVSTHKNQVPWLTDGDYASYWRGAKTGWVEITLPEDKPCYGLYICFGAILTSWEVQAQGEGGQWQTIYTPEDAFYHQFVPLPGLTHFRIFSKPGKDQKPVAISEIRLIGPGALPEWVQAWRRMEGKADLMVVVAHPDDELLFMGGTIPHYAGELQKKVIVTYVVNTHSRRKSELLDGLWLCGVRDYPETGTMPDNFQLSLKKLYKLWDERRLVTRITRLIRQYRPDVLVTHDVKGEYGHAAHKAAADVCKKGLLLAKDPGYTVKTHPEYGPWEIPKMYLHLYPERQMRMDWHKPLVAFDGRTAFEMADAAFRMHVSQQRDVYTMENVSEYDNALFGLYYSAVGPDVLRNDFFENLPVH